MGSAEALQLFDNPNVNKKSDTTLNQALELLSNQTAKKDRQITKKDEQIYDLTKALVLLHGKNQVNQMLYSEVISRELHVATSKKRWWKFLKKPSRASNKVAALVEGINKCWQHENKQEALDSYFGGGYVAS
ncbi:MAG: hypothetical protein LBJ38_02155 [Oscillospiraceae bacterium]|nr:hypothetical protein [Oscillospiraceae bacterium]